MNKFYIPSLETTLIESYSLKFYNDFCYYIKIESLMRVKIKLSPKPRDLSPIFSHWILTKELLCWCRLFVSVIFFNVTCNYSWVS